MAELETTKSADGTYICHEYKNIRISIHKPTCIIRVLYRGKTEDNTSELDWTTVMITKYHEEETIDNITITGLFDYILICTLIIYKKYKKEMFQYYFPFESRKDSSHTTEGKILCSLVDNNTPMLNNVYVHDKYVPLFNILCKNFLSCTSIGETDLPTHGLKKGIPTWKLHEYVKSTMVTQEFIDSKFTDNIKGIYV